MQTHLFSMAHDKELSTYLTEIREELDDLKKQDLSQLEKNEAVELLVSNVLKACSEDAVAVLCDPTASRVFESFFEDVRCESLLSFLREICDNLFIICSKYSLTVQHGDCI